MRLFERFHATLGQYHPLIWVLVGGTVFARAAAFMSLPFLAIYLSRTSGMDPFVIGIVMGLGALAGTFGGFIGGNLSDRFGRKVVMISTLFVWTGVFLGFALAKHVFVFMVLNLLNGLCRSFFEPTSQALMADLTPPEKRMRVFGFRYMAINVGAAVGPLAGAYLATISGPLAFVITGITYLAYGFILLIMMRRFGGEPATPQETERVRFTAALNVIRKDAALGWFILGGIVGAIGYSQIQTNLPLHLDALFGENNSLYPALLALNAVTVILLQMVITRWGEKRSLLGNLVLGSLLFALGLSFFSAGEHWSFFVLGMFILTLGEILSFPSGNMFIDRLAPEPMRGTYFGAGGFQAIGFFIGPSLGGWLLDTVGGTTLFLTTAFLAASGILFYWLGHQAFLRRNRPAAPALPAEPLTCSGKKAGHARGSG